MGVAVAYGNRTGVFIVATGRIYASENELLRKHIVRIFFLEIDLSVFLKDKVVPTNLAFF